MAQRFENASLVLGAGRRPVGEAVPFVGRTGAEHSTAALAVVDAALAIAEQVEGVEDVRQLMRLWQAAHVWGHPECLFLNPISAGQEPQARNSRFVQAFGERSR
ncbi:hypothetical protein ACIBQ5_33805 [Streptomyces massasporeus]|uniref:hypothetical protein n=1 Tax=Streptomyces massasporeus TaxID=67324 RepID=UPI0037B4E90F